MKRFLLTATTLLLILPVIGGMVWGWLSIAERTIWHLALTALLGLAIVSVVVFWETIAFTQALPGWPIFWRMFRWNILAGALLGAAAFFIKQPAVLLLLVALGLLLLIPRLNYDAGGPKWTYALRDVRYWPLATLWLGAGLYLPFRIIFWVPPAEGLKAQAASAIVRFVIAGLIFVCSLLILVRFLRRLREAEQRT